MPAQKDELYVSVEDYFACEARSEIRHEYVNGYLFAMSGATYKHNLITSNLFVLLYSRLRGGPCKAFKEAFKVHVEATNCFYYPDVMVSCAKLSQQAVFTDQPVLLVEVISPSTSSIDRREKLIAYKQIPSLREYMIIHQRKRCVEIYRRNEAGNWGACELATGTAFEINSIPGGPVTVSMEELYEAADGDGEATPVVREDETDYSWLNESESEE